MPYKVLCSAVLVAAATGLPCPRPSHALEAGAAAFDISPQTLPALRNGGFLQAQASQVDDPLFARALVLAQGEETIAIVIVDSCMFPRTLCDEIKRVAATRTKIPPDRILISATHTHSAPSALSFCLACRRDEAYVKYVPGRVAEAIARAHAVRAPARLGWSKLRTTGLTHCRRWITRSDRMGVDPFGQQTVRAMMHPGYQNPDYVCPAGPVDPWLTVCRVIRTQDSAPICLLANLSMHYFGAGRGFSADYFGDVVRLLEGKHKRAAPDFVAIMSQGTSGDLHWMDYSQPRRSRSRADYAGLVEKHIAEAIKTIEYKDDVPLAMAEKRLVLKRRLPSRARLEWARPLNAARGDQSPRNRPEVYAEQAEWIHAHPDEEIVLQAVRVGDLAITGIPNEVYGITGLKLKRQSPLAVTLNLELANGAAGYIPPPEQHRLGGYTTWPARSAGLAEDAEPRIVEELLTLLETVAGKPRRNVTVPATPYSQAVAAVSQAASHWRLEDMVTGQLSTGDPRAVLRAEEGVALFLPGPADRGFSAGEYGNRCVYLAGGRLHGSVPFPIRTVSLWFWSGLPSEALDGHVLFSSGNTSLRLVAGQAGLGMLELVCGDQRVPGGDKIVPRAWHHVVLSLHGKVGTVYLDGQRVCALPGPVVLDGKLTVGDGPDTPRKRRFDGKIDELHVAPRGLTRSQVNQLFQSAGRPEPQGRGSVAPD